MRRKATAAAMGAEVVAAKVVENCSQDTVNKDGWSQQ